MIKHALFILIFIIQCINISAGSFRQLSVKEGLSSRQVFQINKDSDGYIWIFTPLGVDRYDGNEFRHYKLDETLEARDHILSSTIMTRDQSGNIWISLKNGKIYTYNKIKDIFILKADLSQATTSPIILNDILFDSENHLLACMSTGIYLVDVTTNTISAVALKNEYVNRIIQADANTFYAGTNTHIYKIVYEQANKPYSVQVLNFPFEVRTESLYQSGKKLYIGTFSDGAFTIDLMDGKVSSFNSFVPSVPVRTFMETNHSVLIATDGSGVYEVDKINHELINRYITNEDDERSLSGNTVSDIYVDERNGIWISTYTNGISYLDSGNPDINWVKHGHNNRNSLVSSHVNTVIQDSEGDYWYGTNNGISLYRPATGKCTHFLNDTENTGYSRVILALCEDNSGNIWTGGYGIGVYCINKKTGNVQKLKTRNNNADEGMSTDYVYSIYSEGSNIWLGGIEGEFTCYNTATKTYTYYPIDCIGDIKPGYNNSLLIAGCQGLAIFNKSTGETKWYRTFGNLSLSYPIRCLLQSSSGEIWLATDGEGLIRFNPVNNQSRIYTTNDGLVSNTINSLVEDDAKRIWFNTEKELYCLDLKTDRIMNMNDYLDISWGYYNPNASIKLQNGNLAFGTAEGLITFTPYFDFDRGESVKLIFTDFKLLYQSVKAGTKGSTLQQAINETSKIKLKYEQNSFSLFFSAINFAHPHKIKYAYKLDNFNDDWEYSNTTESVNYMNLSPGKYVFRLKAINKYTQQEVAERNIEIIIGRPFWSSWWAILLYAIIIFVFVYLTIQFTRHKINEYNTREKIRSFINIAHDIRTPITLIKAPLSELEAQQDLPDESKKALSVASKNAEKLFVMVTQLLDLQKTEMHPERLYVAKQDINQYMNDKISDFKLAAIQKGLDLVLNIEPDFPSVWFDKDKMNKIMDNLLSNALKYTEKGLITVTIKYSRYKWYIEVKDTGIGIPEKDQNNLFHQFYRAGNAVNSDESGSGIGLVITRRMIKQQHGRITFNSIENQGTTFTVTFPRKIKVPSITETTHKSEETIISHKPKTIIKPLTKKNVLLLAEDDKDMREYLTESLSAEYEVVSVIDGGKALELAKEINPDIIISDIIMPVLQGDELCRILKSSVETSHIPIILLTALNERENIIFGLEAGANDYIIKPFDFSVLKVRIRNILQNRQHLRETVLLSETNLTEIDYTSQLDKEFLDRAMEIINTELANPEFSINDFCQELGMSRTSVYNKIKTLTDQSPNDFIRIIRLNKSRELLLSRRYTISEVSSMVGFSDPKYFSTCFKKQFGISPSKI